jgi:glycine cleavage system H protein
MGTAEGYRYTKDHEWVKDEGDNLYRIGISEFAQKELGEVVFVELPAVGKLVKHGETLCVVESTKAASDVYAPISGKVVEVNSALSSDPSDINNYPLERGWLVRIEATNAEEVGHLMSAEQYRRHVGE